MLMLMMVLWHHVFTTFWIGQASISQPLIFGFHWQGLGLSHSSGSLLRNLAVSHSITSNPFIQSQASSTAYAEQETMRALKKECYCPACVLWIFESQSPGPWAHSISGLFFFWDPAGVSVKTVTILGSWLVGWESESWLDLTSVPLTSDCHP